MTNNDYYADKVYVYKYGDPMIEETVRMLKSYYAAAKQRMFVTKWYRCESKTVMISVTKVA